MVVTGDSGIGSELICGLRVAGRRCELASVYRDSRQRVKARRPWVISYIGLDGKRRREATTATTKDQAWVLLREKLNQISQARIAGVESLEAVESRLFSDFVQSEYLPHCKGVHTSETYSSGCDLASRVLPFFCKKPLRAITTGDILKFIDQRLQSPTRFGRPRMPATVNREFRFVSAALSEAFRRGYIDRNPARGIKSLRERNDKLRWLSEQEEHRILALSPSFLKPMILVCLNTGLRRKELLNLKWADVDYENRLVRIPHSKNGKTRYLPMNESLEGVLRHMPPFVGKDGSSPFVFVNPDTGFPYRDISHSFKRVCRRAGLDDVTLHTLRHTFASRLAQADVQPTVIQQLLGHGSLQVTMRYAHLAPQNLRNAVDVIDKSRKQGMSGTSTAQIRSLRRRSV